MSATTEATARPTPLEDLPAAIQVFFRHPSPLMIFGTAALFVGLRLAWGDWSVWDLAVVIAIAGFWPIQEWLIHVFILHWKPFEVFGRRIDLYVARRHREHHEEPWLLEHVYVPTPTVVTGLLVGVPLVAVAWFAWLPVSMGLTAFATFFVLGSLYEWTHFLIHTAYKPKTEFYRRLWRHHRLHHFKNENYWWGVSRTEGDWLLGTAPDPGDVEKSTTVREINRR